MTFAAFDMIELTEGKITGTVLILIGLLVIVLYRSSLKKDEKPCTESVPAQVVRVEKSSAYSKKYHRYRRKYKPTYEYRCGSDTHTVTLPGLQFRPRKEGEHVTVFVNPNAPEQFYDPKYQTCRAVPAWIFAGVFLVLGILLMFT